MVKSSNELCDSRIIHQERIEKAQKLAPEPEKIDQLAQLFKALADPGRIKILHALGQQEMCVCDLAALLQVSESAASHQLRMLRQLQLVTNRREGPVLYYRLNSERATELINLAIRQTKD